MASRAAGWGLTAAVVALGVALAAWGVALARRAPAEHGLLAARPVAVRDAAAAAGDPAPVRLQGTLVAVPPLVTRRGRELALQLLEVTHEGAAGEAVVAYRRAQPSRVFLSDGDSVVAVDPAEVDPGLLPLLAAGALQAGGRLPPEVAAEVVPGFDALPDQAGAAVRVRGIGAGVTVVAYGALALREGVPSLVPAAGAPLVVAPMTVAEVERVIRSRDRLARLAGWSLVLVGALLAAGVPLRRVLRPVIRPVRSGRSGA